MFGISSFSRSPFATLPANTIALLISESFFVESDGTQQADYLYTRSENSNLNASADNTAELYVDITEPFAATDAATLVADMLQSITETLISASSRSITARFLCVITEGVDLDDTNATGAVIYFSIDEGVSNADTRTIFAGFASSLDEGITNLSSESITAQFSVSRTEAITIAEHLEAHGWIRIIDNQDPNWVPVNDAQ